MSGKINLVSLLTALFCITNSAVFVRCDSSGANTTARPFFELCSDHYQFTAHCNEDETEVTYDCSHPQSEKVQNKTFFKNSFSISIDSNFMIFRYWNCTKLFFRNHWNRFLYVTARLYRLITDRWVTNLNWTCCQLLESINCPSKPESWKKSTKSFSNRSTCCRLIRAHSKNW